MTQATHSRRSAAVIVVTLALSLLLQGGFVDAVEPPAAEARMPAPVQEIFQRLPETLDDWKAEGFEGAIALQVFPMAGREDLVARFDPRRLETCPPIGEDDPLEAIAQQARDAQIVIINEAHDQPFHRHVIERLGLALADEFTTFAAETFSKEALSNREPGSITDDLGSYSDEPMFGRELRALDEAGYGFVAYEIRKHQRVPEDSSDAERVVAREEAQAVNLIDEVLRDRPNERILVHVGYAHAYEAPVDNFDQEIEWFAARLKRKTGVDPLTISQTTCSLEETEADNVYQGLQLVDGTPALPHPAAVDLVLAHPPLRFDHQRPAWRTAIGDIATEVPDAFLGADERIVIEARRPGQSLDEVPTERLLLYPEESVPLLLPSGQWELRAWNKNGPYRRPLELEVGEDS